MTKNLCIIRVNGFRLLFSEEHNARIHTIAALLVIAAGFYFDVSNSDWIALCFAIGFVFTTEIINTAVENLGDFVSIKQSEPMKKIKDLSAAAVLVSVITAITIGLIVFLSA